jgi:protein-S-isoprenylcysteine O-methyltransferase Ste14
MEPGQEQDAARKMIVKKAIIIVPAAVILTGLALFVPAGTLDYWQAWAFMAVLFIPFIFVATYFLGKDPKFLERRLRTKENVAGQKKLIRATQLLFVIALLVPGLDHRFGWSQVPSWLAITADLLVFLGYMLIFLVFKENSYASRIVEVEKGQKVISTGPYAIVRHPMYSGTALMYLSMPVALGSYWAIALFAPIILFIMVFRIADEERLLLKELPGYRGYIEKVRYRLIPGVW